MSSIASAERVIEKENVTLSAFITGYVTSADGTTIGYRQIGSGPGLLVLHGGTRAGHHYLLLAEALADTYRVTIPDRRGRGLSGPISKDYSLATEIEDVRALLNATDARYVLGHSGGGIFALESALELPFRKLALYEPAIDINGSLPLDWLPAVEHAIAQRDSARAFAIFFKGLQLNWMSRLPIWTLTAFSNLMLKTDEGKEMVDLLPTIIWEVKGYQERLAQGLTYERYRSITADTLLFGGSKSPGYLLYALRTLAATIPNAELRIIDGLGHNAPDQDAPEQIAAELKKFLG